MGSSRPRIICCKFLNSLQALHCAILLLLHLLLLLLLQLLLLLLPLLLQLLLLYLMKLIILQPLLLLYHALDSCSRRLRLVCRSKLRLL